MGKSTIMHFDGCVKHILDKIETMHHANKYNAFTEL